MPMQERVAIGILLVASTGGIGCSSSSDEGPAQSTADASFDQGGVDHSVASDAVEEVGQPDAGGDAGGASHTCVACLFGSGDNCAVDQYCTANFTCVPGCKGDTSCASGACNANHECERCLNDLECGADHVCGTGTCGPRCNVPNDCSVGFDCCDNHCVDLGRDVRHCGACASSCPNTQFCGAGGSNASCMGVLIANVCANTKTTRILDGLPLDDAAGAILQDGVVASCAPSPAASSAAQNVPGPLNPSTGQPVAGGGNLLTATGGYVVQKVVAYLDSVGATPVRLTPGASQWEYRGPATAGDAGADAGAGPIIGSIAYNQVTHSHDYIVVELVRDPLSGTLVLIVFGTEPESTTAGAYYVAKHMLPNRASFDKAWYLFDWTGAGDAGPSDSDTLQTVASGP